MSDTMTPEVVQLLEANNALQQEVEKRSGAEQALLQAKEQLEAVLEAVPGGVSWIGSDLVYIGINSRLAAMFNLPPEGFVGREIGFLASSPWFTEYVTRFFENDEKAACREIDIEVEGQRQSYMIMAQKYHEGSAAVFVGIDITERKLGEEQLRKLALYDSLTGLPNRTLFMARLEKAFRYSQREKDYGMGLLFLDLDRFKNINDSLGHIVGDEVLVAIARRLESELRATDTVARLAGDEFVFLLEHINGPGDVTRVAERLLEIMDEPLTVQGRRIVTPVSMGIALGHAGYLQPEDLLRDADTALYRAKALGRARYEIFDEQMHAEVMTRLKLEGDLRKALEGSEMVLHYQPIMELATGTLSGFECLVRWPRGSAEAVSPGQFIPVAEECGLIVPMDDWVLREACTQLRRWLDGAAAAPPRLTVSVNLSARHFSNPNLAEKIERVLRETGLPSKNLKLEITEGLLMTQDGDVSRTLELLRDIGVHLSMDDFGTGYSSLSYVHRFPLDSLKIDQSFVHRMADSPRDRSIVGTIVNLAHHLGLEVVAEGVETSEQLAILREMQCGYGQGYFFSRPLTAEAAGNMLLQGAAATPPA